MDPPALLVVLVLLHPSSLLSLYSFILLYILNDQLYIPPISLLFTSIAGGLGGCGGQSGRGGPGGSGGHGGNVTITVTDPKLLVLVEGMKIKQS